MRTTRIIHKFPESATAEEVQQAVEALAPRWARQKRQYLAEALRVSKRTASRYLSTGCEGSEATIVHLVRIANGYDVEGLDVEQTASMSELLEEH